MAQDETGVAPYHCWHTVSKFTNAFERFDSERCCFCGAEVIVVYRMQPPPYHGRYAPCVWTYDRRDEASQHCPGRISTMPNDKPMTAINNVPLIPAPQTVQKPMIDTVTPSGKK